MSTNQNNLLWQIYLKLKNKPRFYSEVDSLQINTSKSFREYISTLDTNTSHLIMIDIFPQMKTSMSLDVDSILKSQIVVLSRSKTLISRRAYYKIMESLIDNGYLYKISKNEYVVSRSMINAITDSQWNYLTESFKKEYPLRQSFNLE